MLEPRIARAACSISSRANISFLLRYFFWDVQWINYAAYLSGSLLLAHFSREWTCLILLTNGLWGINNNILVLEDSWQTFFERVIFDKEIFGVRGPLRERERDKESEGLWYTAKGQRRSSVLLYFPSANRLKCFHSITSQIPPGSFHEFRFIFIRSSSIRKYWDQHHNTLFHSFYCFKQQFWCIFSFVINNFKKYFSFFSIHEWTLLFFF